MWPGTVRSAPSESEGNPARRGGAGRQPKGDNTALKTRGLHGLAGFGQGRDEVMKRGWSLGQCLLRIAIIQRDRGAQFG